MSEFNDIIKRLNNLKNFETLTEQEIDYLTTPKKELNFEFSFQKDDGTVKNVKGYRIQFNNALGPTKGGLRYHHEVDLDEVKSLAFWMALKTSLSGLPYGGAKGGVEINPKELSNKEYENLSRAFIREIADHIGPWKDIPAPDVYTNPQVMAWMLDEYEKIKGKHVPGVITGKPLELGGSKARSYSTAQGGIYVLLEVLKKFNKTNEETSVIIQGFGNAGMHVARILHSLGLKIIGVSDSKGAIYNSNGFDVPELIKYKTEKKCVKGFDGEDLTNEEILEKESDVLIPAALSGSIHEKNAENIKAKIILELANGPVTREADEILYKNDILVIPDILANAGGVIVSYYEWVQNNTGDYWEEDFVLEKLKKQITNAFNKTWNKKEEKNIMMRDAAYLVAINRILAAAKLRGDL